MADDTPTSFQVRYTGGLADVEIEGRIVIAGQVVDVSEDTAARVSHFEDWELVDPKHKPKAAKPQAPTGG